MNIKSKVYLIILTYNRWEDILECLESSYRSYYDNLQIVVIDNNSQDETVQKIELWAQGKFVYENKNILKNYSSPPIPKPIPYIIYSKINGENGGNPESEKNIQKNLNSKYNTLVIIKNDKNRGFSGGINPGLRYVISKGDGDYVWLLNPDMVIENRNISEMVKLANNQKNIIMGTVVKNYSKPKDVLFYGGAKIKNYTGTIKFITKKKDIKKLDYISGGSLFTHISNFTKFGLLPENYFIYWEETDWCTKAILEGNLKLLVCEKAICYDKISSFMGKGFFSEYYYTLGAFKYFKKYKPEYLKFIMVLNIFRILKRAATNRFENIKAIRKAILDFRKLNLEKEI